jgi:hypothetical protein
MAFPAWANAGIPMLALSWPVQWLAFIPVVAGEAAITAKALQLGYWSSLKPIAIANLWSTLVGIPIAWFVLLLIEVAGGAMLSIMPEHVAGSPAFRYAIFPLFAAWIGGSSPLELKAAFLVLMAVFCWVSIAVEHRVLQHYTSPAAQPLLRRCVKEANIASYVLLSAVTLITFELTS